MSRIKKVLLALFSLAISGMFFQEDMQPGNEDFVEITDVLMSWGLAIIIYFILKRVIVGANENQVPDNRPWWKKLLNPRDRFGDSPGGGSGGCD